MARGVNKVIAIGNLGKDPETRYLPSGAAVCNFSIAVSESWKDKQTGEQKERTEWMNIEVWGNTAEACQKYLTKGSQCYVEGKLQTDKWQDKDGNDRWSTKIRADSVQFLGSKGDGNRPPIHQNTDEGAIQKQLDKNAPEYDDDIPF
jgi:single-strand DNA-binding protein